jgi:aspartate carbamoyltransferase regulatory subunit
MGQKEWYDKSSKIDFIVTEKNSFCITKWNKEVDTINIKWDREYSLVCQNCSLLLNRKITLRTILKIWSQVSQILVRAVIPAKGN